MANRTKKLKVHNVAGASVRVYMDLSTETNQALETLAQMQGRTKKGQLEFMILEAVREFQAKDSETSKREKQARKGRK